MQNLARALINLAAFIELSDDEVMDPDDACQALEQMVADLSGLNEGEVIALREARDQLRAESTSITRLGFLSEFMTSYRIEDDESE